MMYTMGYPKISGTRMPSATRTSPRTVERLWIFERLWGWGSKFGTTKCRTIYISNFQNCEY